MLRSKKVRIAAGLGISLVMLAGAFYKTRFSEFWNALREINLTALVLCLAFFGLSCVFRAFLWRVTTSPIKRVPLSTLFGGVMIGYMANNFLPLRAGELIRSYYLSARTGIAYASAFSTVCIERALDVFSLGLLLAAGLGWGIRGLAPRASSEALTVLAIVLVAGALIFNGFLRLNKSPKKYSGILGHFRERIVEFIEPVVNLQQPRTVLVLISLSLLAWASNYFSVAFLIRDVGQDHLEAAMLLLLFINLGLLIPSSPGAIGVMQFAFWMALAPFQISREQALALSLAYQGTVYLFTLFTGLTFYLLGHLNGNRAVEEPGLMESKI
ncbi:MAG: flippase-like domain-containing protein [Firmicutes bacterium]|nr:flippase-like domain-containing protein [Bacillota bacterium]